MLRKGQLCPNEVMIMNPPVICYGSLWKPSAHFTSMIYRSSKWWIYPRQMVKFTQSNHTSQRKDSCKFRKAQEIPRVVQWLSSPPSTQVVALMVVFQAQPSISELVMIRSVQFSSHHLFTIETAIDRGIQSDGICNMPRFTIICLPKKSPNLMLSARCPS